MKLVIHRNIKDCYLLI